MTLQAVRPGRSPVCQRHRWRGSALRRLLPILLVAAPLRAQMEGVAATRHNLSVTGPGEVRSLTETQVCKFCHIPHSAVTPEALWGHALSRATYATPQLRRGRPNAAPAPQPDGASRLCLSCHDGTVALGDVVGEPREIAMTGRERFQAGERGFIGTDLSGSHPVSFVIEDVAEERLDPSTDIGTQPLSAIRAAPGVKLDKANKMQCTSCHDPHSDAYYREGVVPRFWLAPTVDEVCTSCHATR